MTTSRGSAVPARQPSHPDSAAAPRPDGVLLLLRSLLFNLMFYVNVTILMLVSLPTLVMPHRLQLVFIRAWALSSLWLLRVICGTRIEWRGVHNIPSGGCIVACKHQSFLETFAVYKILDDPTFVLKRELMWIPLFGWHMAKAGVIPIDRGAGVAALSRMTARARAALARARQVIIYPEGTRRPPGAEPSYKGGVAYLYDKAGVPCVPLALNSGLFWPRRSLLRYPGTVVVEALAPIAPGLDRRVFLGELQSRLEEASTRLLQETGISDQVSGN
jgi:1-acyl-sn-glycerol-3-phosphate acyltransferase